MCKLRLAVCGLLLTTLFAAAAISSRALVFFFFQAEDGIRDLTVTGVQTCALPILVRVCLPATHPSLLPPDSSFIRTPSGSVCSARGNLCPGPCLLSPRLPQVAPVDRKSVV